MKKMMMIIMTIIIKFNTYFYSTGIMVKQRLECYVMLTLPVFLNTKAGST